MSNDRFTQIDFATRDQLRAPQEKEKILVINADAFSRKATAAMRC